MNLYPIAYIERKPIIMKNENVKKDFITRKDCEKIKIMNPMLGHNKWTVKNFVVKFNLLNSGYNPRGGILNSVAN
jgi:hypothetical protein